MSKNSQKNQVVEFVWPDCDIIFSHFIELWNHKRIHLSFAIFQGRFSHASFIHL